MGNKLNIKKILIDINHPAHIHYFKNCVHILSNKGYQFLFVVRDRESTIDLIKSTGFDYVNKGNWKSGMVQKMLAYPRIDYKVFKIAKSFKPDLFLSFASGYAAHVATLMRKPHIAFDDTEQAKLSHFLYRPFTDIILSPSCYNKKLSKNQYLFNSYMELCYLHPKYFSPNKFVKTQLGLNEKEKYCIIRFVAFDANHDVGLHGLNYNDKIKLVRELSNFCKVFISSENELPEELEKYKFNLHPSLLHDALAFASLYIGEGGTTASEAVDLGTPAILVNSGYAGLQDEQERYGSLFRLTNIAEILQKSTEILSDNSSKMKYGLIRDRILNEKIDPTAFMVWFIENYPESKYIYRNNSDIQNNFKFNINNK